MEGGKVIILFCLALFLFLPSVNAQVVGGYTPDVCYFSYQTNVKYEKWEAYALFYTDNGYFTSQTSGTKKLYYAYVPCGFYQMNIRDDSLPLPSLFEDENREFYVGLDGGLDMDIVDYYYDYISLKFKFKYPDGYDTKIQFKWIYADGTYQIFQYNFSEYNNVWKQHTYYIPVKGLAKLEITFQNHPTEKRILYFPFYSYTMATVPKESLEMETYRDWVYFVKYLDYYPYHTFMAFLQVQENIGPGYGGYEEYYPSVLNTWIENEDVYYNFTVPVWIPSTPTMHIRTCIKDYYIDRFRNNFPSCGSWAEYSTIEQLSCDPDLTYLYIKPKSVNPGGNLYVHAEYFYGCSGWKAEIHLDSCTGPLYTNGTIMHNNLNINFNAPTTEGTYDFWLCVDVDKNGNFESDERWFLGSVEVSSVCSGTPTLNLEKTTVFVGEKMKASVTGLSGCKGFTVDIRLNDCNTGPRLGHYDYYYEDHTIISIDKTILDAYGWTYGTHKVFGCVDIDNDGTYEPDEYDFVEVNVYEQPELKAIYGNFTDCFLNVQVKGVDEFDWEATNLYSGEEKVGHSFGSIKLSNVSCGLWRVRLEAEGFKTLTFDIFADILSYRGWSVNMYPDKAINFYIISLDPETKSAKIRFEPDLDEVSNLRIQFWTPDKNLKYYEGIESTLNTEIEVPANAVVPTDMDYSFSTYGFHMIRFIIDKKVCEPAFQEWCDRWGFDIYEWSYTLTPNWVDLSETGEKVNNLWNFTLLAEHWGFNPHLSRYAILTIENMTFRSIGTPSKDFVVYEFNNIYLPKNDYPSVKFCIAEHSNNHIYCITGRISNGQYISGKEEISKKQKIENPFLAFFTLPIVTALLTSLIISGYVGFKAHPYLAILVFIGLTISFAYLSMVNPSLIIFYIVIASAFIGRFILEVWVHR